MLFLFDLPGCKSNCRAYSYSPSAASMTRKSYSQLVCFRPRGVSQKRNYILLVKFVEDPAMCEKQKKPYVQRPHLALCSAPKCGVLAPYQQVQRTPLIFGFQTEILHRPC